MYFQIYKDNRGEWRWRLRAKNHETVAVSSESYVRKDSCLHAIGLVKASSNAPVYEA